MYLLIVVVLGLIQGIAEFLPISSSGHLVVLYEFFSINKNVIMLSIILHVATLLSVVIVYRKVLLQLIKQPFCKTNLLILVATLFTVIIVLLFKNIIESLFSTSFIIYCFLFTAVMLYVSELIYKKHTKKQLSNSFSKSSSGLLSETNNITNLPISFKQALLIGVSQGVATIPGISRSGTTIATGLMLGVNKNQVANFSFLLSIPIIIASLAYELIKVSSYSLVFNFTIWQLGVGFLVAFIVGLISLKFMLKMVNKQKLYVFSIYLIILSFALVLIKLFV